MNRTLPFTVFPLVCSFSLFADEIQDMSDPLAVYTQAGAGMTNNGLNVKIGNSYDTGDIDTMAMNIIELKGIAGDVLGVDGDDSIDTVRFRNFSLDKTNGRGSQIDVNWDFDNHLGSASYSFIQALPSIGAVQFYPLAGVGLTVTDTAKFTTTEGNDFGSVGYAIPSSFAVVGTYAKVTITEDIWLNYNPMYMTTLNNNSRMKDMMDGFYHEVVASYQLNPTQTVRTYANYNDTDSNVDKDWSWRVEFNHQF